jgi:hypothetical protein
MVGFGLGSELALVTFLLEDKDDTYALVGSNFGPFTSLLVAETSAIESLGEKYAV